MRNLYYDFQIDGKPIPTPDADIQIVPTDKEAADSGFDQSDVYHRTVISSKKSFVIQYTHMTAEEFLYMLDLMMGKNQFTVEHRLYGTRPRTVKAYCANFPVFLHNARTGTMRKAKFTITPCEEETEC